MRDVHGLLSIVTISILAEERSLALTSINFLRADLPGFARLLLIYLKTMGWRR
jgi:hypothetical protein